MALQGKFVLNNAHFSPLSIFGLGTFIAFSGSKIYRNRGGCVAKRDNGPLPEGRYWIVERPTGGFLSRMYTKTREIPSWMTKKPIDHTEWFALYRDDGLIDNKTWINGIERGNFRLHLIGPMGLSQGCITLQHYADFSIIRRALLSTSKIPIYSTGLKAYGMIEVIVTYANACP